ncbi:MAG: T9SS type A sorting domain-containing protein [Chitinophagales bacterium]
MKKHLSIICGAFLITHYSFSQPVMQWENSIGGTNTDAASSIDHTSDGGAIICGDSYSAIGGDKTENSLGDDIWVIKLDSAGNIEWQNTIGGTLSDAGDVCHQTADGGYIVGATSYSGHCADKAENPKGASDYWVIKLNASGDIVWENTIGAKGQEILTDINELPGGGYIVAGTSDSKIGFDKTEDRHGIYPDYWVMQLDATGNIIWQNTIGGMLSEIKPVIVATPDGGFMVGGWSDSNIGFEKTENCIGGFDYWIIKLDASGNVEWDNTMGSTYDDELTSIIPVADGGYLLGGVGEFDYWISKINASGSIIWETIFGGTGYDRLGSMETTNDGNILLCGYSNSGISGNKTVPLINDMDYWVIKMDTSGNSIWQEDYGTVKADYIYSGTQTSDHGYLLCGYTTGGISGNKTEANMGGNDIWIVKLAPDNCTAEICNGIDDDCNGITDDGIVISINITTDDETTICSNSDVLLEATYTGTSVQWQRSGVNVAGQIYPTYAVAASGDYSCVTSTTCSTQTSNVISVTVNPTPKATIAAGGPTSFCAGGSVELTATTNIGTSYQWEKNGFSIGGATSNHYTATTAGNYKCRITVGATGCYKESKKIVVSIVCKEGQDTKDSDFNIFPNPVHNEFTITGSVSEDNPLIKIYNPVGQLILSKQLNVENNSVNEIINFSKLSAYKNLINGIYLVKITDGNSEHVIKIVFEN